VKRIAFAVVVLTIVASAARASDDGALSATPAVVMLKGSFGQSTTQRLTLTNTTSREFAFEMQAKDVVVRDGKRVFVPAGEIDGSIAATAVFSRRSIIVKPHSSESVDATVTLPPRAQNRGIVLFFHGKTKFMNGTVPMVASLGTLLTFSVSDGIAVEPRSLEVTPQSAAHNLAIAETLVNTGTEPVLTHGVAAILDARGALIGRMDLQPRRIFPSERATLAGEYGGELPPGRYRVVVTCDLGTKTLTQSEDFTVR